MWLIRKERGEAPRPTPCGRILKAALLASAIIAGVGAAIAQQSSADPHWANVDCSRTVRPPLDVTSRIKRSMGGTRYEELDHIGPLCMGGQPLARSNLQLQPWDEARRKDDLERELCIAVHTRRMSCSEARHRILDWRP